MPKLLGALLVMWVGTGCLSRARHAQVVESPDPIVGDLRCAQPRLTLLEALRYAPTAPHAAERCELVESL